MTSTHEVIQKLFESEVITTAITDVTLNVALVAGSIAAMAALTSVAYSAGKGWLDAMRGKASGIVMDIPNLIRIGIFIFLIGAYIPVMGAVTQIAGVINRATVPNVLDDEDVVKRMEKFSNQGINVDESQPNGNNQNEDEGNDWNLLSPWTFSFSMTQLVLNGVTVSTSVFMTAVRVIIQGFAITLTKILYIFGPLALAFAIFPNFEGQFDKFFNVFVTVLFLPTTCNILDFVIYNIIGQAIQGEYLLNPIAHLSLNIVILIIYIMAFWITSLFIGSSSAGKVLAMATYMATQMLTKGAGSVAKGTAKAGGSAADAAVDVGRKSMHK